MKLSKKLQIFSQILTVFMKSTYNSKLFENKDESHRLCLSEIIDYDLSAYVNV